MIDFQEHYEKVVIPALMKQFGYKSVMAVPKITKITLNMGVGGAAADKKIVQSAVEELTTIACQKAVITLARKSIAGFKIRQGFPIGCKVVLRRDRMYHFLQRLICVAMPRIRDFRGVKNNGFDGKGNYNLGLKEQIIFPEIDYDKIDSIRGLDIAITTTARTDAEAKALLAGFSFPFRKEAAAQTVKEEEV